jgi:hypothetical protein
MKGSLIERREDIYKSKPGMTHIKYFMKGGLR